jgi:hypothetical protein
MRAGKSAASANRSGHSYSVRVDAAMLPRPVIMLVDDEPQTLTPLLDALGRRFGRDDSKMASMPRSA